MAVPLFVLSMLLVLAFLVALVWELWREGR